MHNTEVFEIIPKLLNKISDFHSGKMHDGNVFCHQNHTELKEKLNLKFSDESASWSEILEFLETYLKNSVNTAHPQYFNQLWAGFSPEGLVSEIITNASNTSMYTYEVAPVATLIEHAVIKELLKLAGMNDGEGIFSTGGSGSNLSAVLAARNKKLSQALTKGLTHQSSELKLYVSKKAHYSFKKAANVLGIGTNNVVAIEANSNDEIDSLALIKQIEQDLQKGHTPFMIAATAGTTVEGSFDNIQDCSKIAKKYDLWLHVDGAYGGSVLYSQKHKNLMSGIELADSLTWDAHKMLGAPLICSVILFKNKGSLKLAHSHSGGDEYIFHNEDNIDLGPDSIQCGRRVDALKWYLTWLKNGTKGLEQNIDHLFDLAKHGESIIQENKNLELLNKVYSINLCFQYKPKSPRIDINKFNIHLRNELLKDGTSMVNYSKRSETAFFRLVITNHKIKSSDIDQFFEKLLNKAEELENTYAR